jgi:hypothetical protein
MITFSKIGSLGRLGNQMFQISAAIGLAQRNKDVAIFNKWDYAKYFKKNFRQDLKTTEITKIFNERTFHYSPIPYSNGTDLLGYFQSEKYFLDCEGTIREYFDFIDDLIDDSIEQNEQTCSIHVRRGDYLGITEYHPVQDLNYYNRSMSYMREKGISKFYVFSDDLKWCMENLPHDNNISYISGNIDIKDLALMSFCKNNIIANSSFSWWGAWLNKNPHKIVIAPSNWFGPAKRGVVTDDLYCNGWIKF